jgi:hypothetical protein
VGHVRLGIAHTWVLHHDNTPVTQQSPPINFWQKQKNSCGSLLTDLSPCALFLYRQLKNHFEGRHFGTFYKIQMSVTDELKGIPAETFQHCYEQ